MQSLVDKNTGQLTAEKQQEQAIASFPSYRLRLRLWPPGPAQ